MAAKSSGVPSAFITPTMKLPPNSSAFLHVHTMRHSLGTEKSGVFCEVVPEKCCTVVHCGTWVAVAVAAFVLPLTPPAGWLVAVAAPSPLVLGCPARLTIVNPPQHSTIASAPPPTQYHHFGRRGRAACPPGKMPCWRGALLGASP